MKHTPGPWKANLICSSLKGPFLQANIQATNGNFIAQIYGGRPDTVCDEDEANLNAHLIAAAPDLLEVCKAILAHWRMNDEKYYESALCTDLIQAIAKAEGREGNEQRTTAF